MKYIYGMVSLLCTVTTSAEHKDSINKNRYDGVGIWARIRKTHLRNHTFNLSIVCSTQRLPLPLTSPLLLQKSSFFFTLNPLKKTLSSGSKAHYWPPCFCLRGQRSQINELLGTITVKYLWTHWKANILTVYCQSNEVRRKCLLKCSVCVADVLSVVLISTFTFSIHLWPAGVTLSLLLPSFYVLLPPPWCLKRSPSLSEGVTPSGFLRVILALSVFVNPFSSHLLFWLDFTSCQKNTTAKKKSNISRNRIQSNWYQMNNLICFFLPQYEGLGAADCRKIFNILTPVRAFFLHFYRKTIKLWDPETTTASCLIVLCGTTIISTVRCTFANLALILLYSGIKNSIEWNYYGLIQWLMYQLFNL